MGIFSGTKVQDVMTERPRAVTPLTTAAEAAQAMATEDVGALPVVDESGDILGIITVDDAMEILLPKDWRQRVPRLFG